MAYTDVWNEGLPLGSANANTIDDIIRTLKLDWRERLNSVLGVAIGTPLADPVTPAGTDLVTLRSELTSAEGNITTLQSLLAAQTFKIYIPVWSAQYWNTGGIAINPARNAGGIAVAQATEVDGTFHFGVVVPVGVTITGYGVNLVDSGGASTLTSNLYKRANTAANPTSVVAKNGTIPVSVSVQASGAVTEVTAALTYYSVQLNVAPSAGQITTVLGVEIYYTSPTANVRI